MADLYYDDMKNENGIATITNGLFYPSIPYHSFNRPFYAKANFYCWADTYIDVFFNENNQIDAKVTSRELTGRAEVSVYNGKTYDNQFHPTSRISTLSYLNGFSVSENDCYGLKTGKDREAFFTGYYAGGFDRAVEDITYHYYEITEGYPTNEKNKIYEMQCSKRAKTLSDGVMSNFVDSLSYTIIDGKAKPIFDSENNSNAKYFICNVFDNNDSFILSRNSKYIYGTNENDPTNLYVLCTYTTSIGSYNEGSFNILNICVDGGSKTIAYAYMSGDTSIVRNINWNEKYCNSATSGVTNDESKIKDLISGVSAYVAIIKPVKQYSINTSLNNWADNIISNTKGGTLYYGVGVICGNTEDTKLFKIYPYITQCSSIPKLKSNFNIDGEKECTKELSCKKHNINCELTVPTNLKWVSNCDAEWIIINPNNGNNSTNIEIEVSANYGETDREGIITFGIDGTEGSFYGDLTYNIIQLGYGGLFFIDSYGNFKTEMVIEKFYQKGERVMWSEDVYVKGIFEIEMAENDCIVYNTYDGNYSDNEKSIVTFSIRTPYTEKNVVENIRFYNQKEEIILTIKITME